MRIPLYPLDRLPASERKAGETVGATSSSEPAIDRADVTLLGVKRATAKELPQPVIFRSYDA